MFTSLSSLAGLVGLAVSFSLVGCSSAPSESHGSAGQAVTRDPSVVDPAFTVCAIDADCVAVPRVGCCNNGWLAAVAADSVDAYTTANACTTPPTFACPRYIVNDTRVAQCNTTGNACELVAAPVATDMDAGPAAN